MSITIRWLLPLVFLRSSFVSSAPSLFPPSDFLRGKFNVLFSTVFIREWRRGAVPAKPLGDRLPLFRRAIFFLHWVCRSVYLLNSASFGRRYYAGLGQTRRLSLQCNRKVQILQKIAAKTKQQYTDVLQWGWTARYVKDALTSGFCFILA